jgi:hypothetical protein
MDPARHAVDDVAGVGREQHAKPATLPADRRHRLDDRTERHPVVRRRRLGDPEVAPDEWRRLTLAEFDEHADTPGILSVAAVPEARLVGVDRHERVAAPHGTISTASRSSMRA